jgi:hypothetical protein
MGYPSIDRIIILKSVIEEYIVAELSGLEPHRMKSNDLLSLTW